MPGSDAYGDSDDDALLFAATQHGQSQAAGDFPDSDRPTKRPRIEAPINTLTSDLGFSEEDLLGDDTLLEAEGIQGEQSPNKRQRLLHAPRINANLERVILTQTQAVPQSQPWEIRGPVWKRPKPPPPPAPKVNAITSYFGNPRNETVPAPAILAPPQSKSLAQIIMASNKEAQKAELVKNLTSIV